jgi:signal peptidase I
MKFKDHLIISLVAVIGAILLKMFVMDVVYIPSHSMESTLFPGDYIIVNKLVYGTSAIPGVPFAQASVFHIPGFRSVESGDVVVFRLPDDVRMNNTGRHPVFVKRCVAVAGDQLELKNGIISINGRELVRMKRNSENQFLTQVKGAIVIPHKGDRVTLSRGTIGEWMDLIRREGHVVDTTGPEITIDGKLTSGYTVGANYIFVLGDNIDYSYDGASWGLLSENNVIGEAEVIYWSQDISNSPPHLSDRFADVRWNRIGTIVR